MFSFGLKEKIILFSVLCVPFLIIYVLLPYFLWFPDNQFANEYFFRAWFYVIFLSFVFIPFSEIILFKRGTFFQRILLITAFIFLGVNLLYHAWAGIDLNQTFATFIFLIFLNFSSNLSTLSKFDLKYYGVFNVILIIMAFGFIVSSFYIQYIYLNIFYIFLICLIVSYLFSINMNGIMDSHV